MKLDELEKSEKVAARCYIRNRRKVWNMFFSMQEVNRGDFISTNSGAIQEVINAYGNEVDPYFDRVVITIDVKTKSTHCYVLHIKSAEGEMLNWYIKSRLSKAELLNPFAYFDKEMTTVPEAKVLYGRTIKTSS